MVELKEKRIIETGLTSEEVEERKKQGKTCHFLKINLKLFQIFHIYLI